jgi:hypothetical protein
MDMKNNGEQVSSEQAVPKQNNEGKSSGSQNENSFIENTTKGLNKTIEKASNKLLTVQETIQTASETVKSVNNAINSVVNKEISHTVELAGEAVRKVGDVMKNFEETVEAAGETLGNITGLVEEPVGLVMGKLENVFKVDSTNRFFNAPLLKGFLVAVSLSVAVWGIVSSLRTEVPAE